MRIALFFPKMNSTYVQIISKREDGEVWNMKATGIVRRIDDLGRVVIPKEIRRTLRIREGDPLEIFVAREGEVILKKYSPIHELGEFAADYADALYEASHVPVFICDRDEVVAVSGTSKKDYESMSISPTVDEAITDRVNDWFSQGETMEVIRGKTEDVSSYAIATIVAGGDPIGCVVLLATKEKEITEMEHRVAETAALFIGKQMED